MRELPPLSDLSRKEKDVLIKTIWKHSNNIGNINQNLFVGLAQVDPLLNSHPIVTTEQLIQAVGHGHNHAAVKLGP